MHLPPRVFAKLDELTLASLIISLIAYFRDRRHRTWTWSSVPPTSIAGESHPLKTRARYPCIRFCVSRSVRNGKRFFVEKMMCIKTLERDWLMSLSSVQVVSQSACPFQGFLSWQGVPESVEPLALGIQDVRLILPWMLLRAMPAACVALTGLVWYGVIVPGFHPGLCCAALSALGLAP